jgi:PTH1 family peptidyl-tRNA hydrolase
MTKIVVGLGNWGDKYAYTWHNVGFMVVDCLADRYGVSPQLKTSMNCRMVQLLTDDNIKVILAQPWTYMNLSGICVDGLMQYYKASLQDLLVVYDDITIDIGTIRIRPNGGAGTHNGMRHIMRTIDSNNFGRVRVGIGKPPIGTSLGDWVTSDVPKEQRPVLAQAVEQAADSVQRWIKGELFDHLSTK